MKEYFDKKSPENTVKYFRNSILRGDLKDALSCFDAQATFIESDGQEIKGLDNIEKALESICLWKPQITSVKHRVTVVDNLAIWIDNYFVKAKLPNGDFIEMNGATACLLKLNAAGDWLWLVDNPFAADHLSS